MGDPAILEAMGLGAFVLAGAPGILSLVGGWTSRSSKALASLASLFGHHAIREVKKAVEG